MGVDNSKIVSNGKEKNKNTFLVGLVQRHERGCKAMALYNKTKIASYFTYGFQRNVVHLGFKILAIISAIYFVSSIFSTKLHKQEKLLLLYPTLTTNWTENQLSLQFNSTEDTFIYLQNEIRDRQVKTRIWFLDEVVKITSLLVSEKEKHLRTTAKIKETIQLRELELEQEKQKTDELTTIFKAENDILKANATLYKEAFDYMSYVIGRMQVPYHGVENYTRYASARLQMLPLANVKQLKPEFGPVVNDVLSFRYRNDVPSCIEVNANRSVFVAVVSAPANFEKRNLIRKTWRQNLNCSNHNGLMGLAGFGFSLGMTEDKITQRKIDEENKMYGDIIQSNISDFYRNLTLKLAGLFNWLVQNCANVDFVFKVDDDVYVNVRNLVHLVQAFNPYNQSMLGTNAVNYFSIDSQLSIPLPDRVGKWSILFKEWPWSQYPPYLLGGAVLIPQATILPVLAAFQTTPLMPFDDTYLTGLCSEKAGIKLYFSSTSFSVLRFRLPSDCDLRRVVAWLADNQTLSHAATEDFYRNTTHKCTEISSGVSKTAYHNDPIQIILK